MFIKNQKKEIYFSFPSFIQLSLNCNNAKKKKTLLRLKFLLFLFLGLQNSECTIFLKIKLRMHNFFLYVKSFKKKKTIHNFCKEKRKQTFKTMENHLSSSPPSPSQLQQKRPIPVRTILVFGSPLSSVVPSLVQLLEDHFSSSQTNSDCTAELLDNLLDIYSPTITPLDPEKIRNAYAIFEELKAKCAKRSERSNKSAHWLIIASSLIFNADIIRKFSPDFFVYLFNDYQTTIKDSVLNSFDQVKYARVIAPLRKQHIEAAHAWIRSRNFSTIPGLFLGADNAHLANIFPVKVNKKKKGESWIRSLDWDSLLRGQKSLSEIVEEAASLVDDRSSLQAFVEENSSKTYDLINHEFEWLENEREKFTRQDIADIRNDIRFVFLIKIMGERSNK